MRLVQVIERRLAGMPQRLLGLPIARLTSNDWVADFSIFYGKVVPKSLVGGFQGFVPRDERVPLPARLGLQQVVVCGL